MASEAPASVVFHQDDPADLRVVRSRPGGQAWTDTWVTVKGGATGAVCVAQRRDRLLVGRHWRPAAGRTFLEFPRGMGEAGEDPIETALRELREETGYRGSKARLLGTIHADTGLLGNPVAVVAVNVGQEPPADTDDEFDEIQWARPSEIETWIRAGEVADGITLSSFLLWRLS